MDTARIREGIRKMRFSTILDRWDSGEMTQETAAELLGMSVRSFQRWRERYEADGEAGLVDRRGGPSPRRAPQEELERMLGLYRDKYADFTVKHFHEQMQKRHDYTLGYTVTQSHLHRAGLVRPAPKRSARRKKRPRRPMRGMMLHQDGSRHAWIEGLPAMDLIVTMDDATSEIYSMILVEEEGSASTFEALREVIGEHGLFCSLYTDRGSHYFHTPEAGGKVSSTVETQVGRALAHLGIEHIGACSPQAPLRQAQETLRTAVRHPAGPPAQGVAARRRAQRRGGQRLAEESYIAEHNARFAVDPEQEGSAFVPDAQRWGAKSCASSRSARSPKTTPSPGTESPCNCRRAACARTSSRRRCACTNIPTEPAPSSSARTGSPTTTPREPSASRLRPSLASCSGPSRTSPVGRACARP